MASGDRLSHGGIDRSQKAGIRSIRSQAARNRTAEFARGAVESAGQSTVVRGIVDGDHRTAKLVQFGGTGKQGTEQRRYQPWAPIKGYDYSYTTGHNADVYG